MCGDVGTGSFHPQSAGGGSELLIRRIPTSVQPGKDTESQLYLASWGLFLSIMILLCV